MDPRNSAQDVYRCDLCKAPIVHSYCDFCDVNLCKPCIGEHISDEYDKHKIVPFQQRKSTLIYPKCGTHPHKICDLQCKDCNIFICTSCVGSKIHKGHDILELDDIYKAKKVKVHTDIDALKSLISPTYERIAHGLQKQIANLDEEYERLMTEISKQGDILHKEIEVVITTMKTEIDDIKVKHREILQKHLNEIQQIQSLIQQTVQLLKEIEESNELSRTIEYNFKISDFSKFPPAVKVSLPNFIPKPIDHQKLYCLFGYITPLSTAMEHHVLMSKKPLDTLEKRLLDQPELDAKIQTFQYCLSNVVYANDEKVWTSGETGEIKCFNIGGRLLEVVETKSGEWPDDIAVDSDGDLLYSDGITRTLHKVKNGQTEELIKLQGWSPCQLCVTSAGHLLVTMNCDDRIQSKVVRYSGSTEKQTIQFDNDGTPLYSCNDKMKYITENRNQDICVADCEIGAIVVVDQYGKLRFRYTGHALINIENDSFVPYGIATDSQSHILTADYYNHCIHILDQNGHFLHYINNCDLEYPWGLCVDTDDNLFVCEYASGNVKKIKFLKQ